MSPTLSTTQPNSEHHPTNQVLVLSGFVVFHPSTYLSGGGGGGGAAPLPSRNFITFATLIMAADAVGEPKRCLEHYAEMGHWGLTPNGPVYEAVARACLASQSWRCVAMEAGGGGGTKRGEG